MNPGADMLALAEVEFDFSKVALGQMVVLKWRGQARSVSGIARPPRSPLRSPTIRRRCAIRPPIESRHKPGMAEWLIVIDVCTHLGCVPTFGAGPYRGWLCPCHGSIYDTAGRIRGGPAPKNLFLPPYSFEVGQQGENRLT